MKEILVVGYGNPLRGDDGVGWHCVRMFHEQKQTGSLAAALRGMHVYEMACHQLEPELAERISTSQFVLFIDATAEGTPGAVAIRKLRPVISSAPFHHQVSPEMLLSYADSLFGRCPDAALITVCGESFELGEQLSGCVEASLDSVLTAMASICASIPVQ